MNCSSLWFRYLRLLRVILQGEIFSSLVKSPVRIQLSKSVVQIITIAEGDLVQLDLLYLLEGFELEKNDMDSR